MDFSAVSNKDIDFVKRFCMLHHLLSEEHMASVRRASNEEVRAVLTVHRLACYTLDSGADNVTKGYFFYQGSKKKEYLEWQMSLIGDELDVRMGGLEQEIERLKFACHSDQDDKVRSLFQKEMHVNPEDIQYLSEELSLLRELSEIKGRIIEALDLSVVYDVDVAVENEQAQDFSSDDVVIFGRFGKN